MNITQQKLLSLHEQLNMALARKPVSKMQVALLQAEIKKLSAQVEREAGE